MQKKKQNTKIHAPFHLYVFFTKAFFLSLVLAATPLIAQDHTVKNDNKKITATSESWLDVVRSSPYWVSKGMYKNLVTIRTWVLSSEAYCEKSERHILFDNRSRFLGYFDNGASPEETQQILNRERAKLFQQGRVDYFVKGAENKIGYPFALGCNQPDADLSLSFARYSGQDTDALLWGTWDGMTIGDKHNLVSLHKALDIVYHDRFKRQHISLPEEVLSTLAGTILIESGGRKHAHSNANARGILQLSPQALNDCNLAEKFHFHRMAQIDCAFQLLEINHRNLLPTFEKTFAALPKHKSDQLYALLLIQAYHGGVGRVNALMTDAELNKATRYFAKHHEQYSAEDIALGMIYHNLGRNLFGFSSLYYVTDVGIAKQLVCSRYTNLSGC
ncbi:hypothetical protein TDB9533_01730 [Thalassocella blandensis]|nr:hypothetical protein TDB9533_01730 [Thalassocella blandensis]